MASWQLVADPLVDKPQHSLILVCTQGIPTLTSLLGLDGQIAVQACDGLQQKLASMLPVPRRSFSEQLWRSARRTGRFVDLFFRNRSPELKSAATNVRTFDPQVYKPLIRLAALQWDLAVCGKGVPPQVRSVSRGLPGLPVFWWAVMVGSCLRACRGGAWAAATFRDVFDLVTPDEVIRAIRSSAGGKSAGHDDLAIDLLKTLLDPRNLNCRTSPSVDFLVEITNDAFALGWMSPFVTKGLIRMITNLKGKIEGAADASQMRPITLLSELLKVPARVLAERISTRLSANPRLLHPSQRAFLRSGDVAQAIHAFVDVAEDAHDVESPLFCVSYDLRKAYDSVQEYTVRASLSLWFPPACY